MKRKVLWQLVWFVLLGFAEITSAGEVNSGPSTAPRATNTVPYGGTNVVAIGTGSARTTDKSEKDQKAAYTFRFYYCDARPEMNPPEATIKAYTSSGNWVCLF